MKMKDEIKKCTIVNEMYDEKVVHMRALDDKDLEQVTGGEIKFCPKKKGNS